MPNSNIIDIVKRYAKNLEEAGFALDGVYLFGSQVKGTTHEGSDIDVAVISPYLRDDTDDNKSFLLWKLRRDIDLRIEPHGFTPEDWANKFEPMPYEIKKTGVKVI